MLFDDLTSEEMEAVKKACLRRKFSKGEYIIKEGEKGQSLFFLRCGTVEVIKELDSSNYKHLKDFEEGDFFGEISFLDDASRTASVVATDDCEVLELTSDKFDALVNTNPTAGMKIFRNIARDIALRLKRNTNELMKAVIFAIEGMKS